LDGAGYEIINVGHSLGGHIAEVVAENRNNTKAYSFDPLYSSLTVNGSNIWRYAPENGIYELSKNEFQYLKDNFGSTFKSIKKELLHTHNLSNIIDNLSTELLSDVYDNINPIANNIFEKSFSFKDIF